MATKIRLTRLGGHKRPYYRVVVLDGRTARDGRAIESLGYYDPLATDKFKVDVERLKSWIAKGAKPSETVRQIVKKLPAGA